MPIVSDGKPGRPSGVSWVKIPNGIRVRNRSKGTDGVVEGLTEIVAGPGRNPDGRTQYRIKVIGAPAVQLAAEDELLIVTDREGLVVVLRQREGYRRYVTERLRAVFAADRFVVAK